MAITKERLFEIYCTFEMDMEYIYYNLNDFLQDIEDGKAEKEPGSMYVMLEFIHDEMRQSIFNRGYNEEIFDESV